MSLSPDFKHQSVVDRSIFGVDRSSGIGTGGDAGMRRRGEEEMGRGDTVTRGHGEGEMGARCSDYLLSISSTPKAPKTNLHEFPN